MLIIAVRTIGGPAYQETIEEMDTELTKVIEDFSRAVDVEALLLAKKNGRHSLPRSGERSFSAISYRATVFA